MDKVICENSLMYYLDDKVLVWCALKIIAVPLPACNTMLLAGEIKVERFVRSKMILK